MKKPRAQLEQELRGKITREKDDLAEMGEGMRFVINFIRWYPDFLLDLTRAESADYDDEELIQRVIMRAKARYQYVDITGCRSLTKTSTTFKEEMVEGLVWEGTKVSYYAPSYKQAAKIGIETFRQIEHDYPALAAHYATKANADTFELSTPYGTQISIAAMRGLNSHKVIAEEYAQEGASYFDSEEYRRVVLPAVRLRYMINGAPDKNYIPFKQQSITSAGRRQNHAYATREEHLRMMARGESAFVMDVPFDVILLSLMRPVAWAKGLKSQLTPEEWAREMESRYTGTDENAIVSDRTLHESRSLLLAETHHCCKDAGCHLLPQDVIYVVGYDVSYSDRVENAKCAAVVVKCTKQKEWLKRDRYLKQVVYVNDWAPRTPMEQARRLKALWYEFTYEGSQTYIAIDAWQYGTAVLNALMMDLGDGLAPLCVYEHEQFRALELEGALPVIYPVKAGGVGARDPDAEMIRNIEMQFANHNVQLLTSNFNEGIEAYKRAHRIKDDLNDAEIYLPYKKTQELIGQIQNLKKVVNSSGIAEKRISHHIQRDSWSALKYAVRFVQLLERIYLMRGSRKKSDWEILFDKHKKQNATLPQTNVRTITRRGGRLY